jgi:hypothetical protein
MASRGLWKLMCLALPWGLGGCLSGPPAENPYLVRGQNPSENPLFVPQGQDAAQYQRVYDTVYDVVLKYFDVASSNMYAGEILGVPRVSTGIFDWWHFESYDSYELWQSTLQSIRRRIQVQIIPAEVGGYFVAIKVYKELEDPGAPVNPHLFRRLRPEDPTDVRGVYPSSNAGLHWIDLGRDTKLEELILSKLKERL